MRLLALCLSALVASPLLAEPGPERSLTLEVHLEDGELFVVPTAGPTGIVTRLGSSEPERLSLEPGPAVRSLPRFAGRVIRVRGRLDPEAGTATVTRLISPRKVRVEGTYDVARKRLLTIDGPLTLRGVIPPPSAAGVLAVRGWSYEDGLEVDAFRGWLNRDTVAADGPLSEGDTVWLRAAGEDFLIAGSRPTRVKAQAIRFSSVASLTVKASAPKPHSAGLPTEAPVVPLRLLQQRPKEKREIN